MLGLTNLTTKKKLPDYYLNGMMKPKSYQEIDEKNHLIHNEVTSSFFVSNEFVDFT